MEIKIAICDDDKALGGQLEKLLMKMLNERGIRCEIDVCTTGETLCKEMNNTEYDLIFLDIELPKMNGVQIGMYIRENQRNDLVQIAYISGKQDYAMELFDVRPINFLVKPLDENKLNKVIDAYVKISGGKNEVFQYKKGFTIYRIEFYKIKYFIRTGRKVMMYTIEGAIEFYESMEKIYESAKQYGFLFIHKSYMINSKYIKKRTYDKVYMTDDKEFSISQSHRQIIREMFKKMEEN